MSCFIDLNADKDDIHGLHKDQSEVIRAVLERRMAGITSLLFEGMETLAIDSDKVDIVYNFKELTPNPNIKEIKNRIVLEVPCLFLIKPQDFQSTSPMHAYLKKHFTLASCSDRARLSLAIFSRVFQSDAMIKKAIKFVLYHELAHIALGHDLKKEPSYGLSKEREKQADLISVKYSGAAEGGVYLFKIMSEFYPIPSLTHPTYQERIKYLEKHQETCASSKNHGSVE